MRYRFLRFRTAAENLFQFCQRFFYRVEIRQIFWCRGLFAVLHDAIFVDDDGGASGGVPCSRKHRKNHVVIFDDLFVQITGEREADFFLLGPRFLRERRIHADADDFRIQIGVLRKDRRDVAHFVGANSRKSGWEKKQHGIFFAEIAA